MSHKHNNNNNNNNKSKSSSNSNSGKDHKNPPAQAGYTSNTNNKQKNDFDYDRNAFIPPGTDGVRSQNVFGRSFQYPFTCPRRLKDKPTELIEAVNDFHYSMLNDLPRNEFYLSCLKEVITPDSVVLEIGTGTGLLSMLAAKLGAKKIFAVEANRDMSNLAVDNIKKNGLDNIITVYNKLSFDFSERDFDVKPNVILSEVFGTLLLGESAHVYISDILRRVCGPGTAVVPKLGTQFASLISSPGLDKFTSVQTWNGIDLSTLNGLKDTSSVVFTKTYGFRFSTVPYEEICEPIPVVDLDFSNCNCDRMERQKKFTVTANQDGVVHAVMLYWEAYSDETKKYVMSTNPRETADNMCRDMQWGQALQLVEDYAYNGEHPVPFVVKKGDQINVTVVFSSDGVLMQFMLTHAKAASADEAASSKQ